MDFVEQNGIFIPKPPPPDILYFIDESYLAQKTGFMQACLFAPQDYYQSTIVPQAQQLLSSLNQKEFKGGSLSQSNYAAYLEFLRLFINSCAAVWDSHPICPIVTIDSEIPYAGERYEWVRNNASGAAAQFGVTDADNLLKSFCRQTLWLLYHHRRICNVPFTNAVQILFDATHFTERDSNAVKLMNNDRLAAPTIWPMNKLLRSYLQTFFSQGLHADFIPRVSNFEFKDSKNELGIQAADLLVHVCRSWLKYEMGSKSGKNIELKRQLFLEVCDGTSVAPDLMNKLSLHSLPDGQVDVAVTDTGLLSTLQLEAS